MICERYIMQVDNNLYDGLSYRNRLTMKIHRYTLTDYFIKSLNIDKDGKYKFSNNQVATFFSKNICCSHICRICSICEHSYWCTCYEYFIKSIICKHIHSIASVQINSKFTNTITG